MDDLDLTPVLEGSPLLTLEKVTLRVGNQWVLPETCWRIRRGENWVIWGANGEGKTTLANALIGNVAVVQGRIHRHYENRRETPNPRQALSLVSPEHYHRLFAREQLLEEMRSFSGRIHHQTRGKEVLADHAKGETSQPGLRADICERLSLDLLLDKPVASLSSGEMQRLLLAWAIMKNPLLLILDEPFNGLDVDARKSLLDLFGMLARNGTHLILITHRLEEISKPFSHVLWLENGRAKWQGSKADFFKILSVERKHQTVSPAFHTAPATAAQNIGQDFNSEKGVLVKMCGVSVRYGDHRILHRLDWTVRAGEHWAVLGPNGAGKSTLLKLLTGDHLQAYANELYLFGKRRGTGESLWDIKRHIGFISDAFHAGYQMQMTGFDVICSGFFDSIGLYRYCTPAQNTIARQWIRTLDLDDFVESPFRYLSFGRQRLILIARAMVKSPRLLILDEPCNGLDVQHRRLALDMIGRIGSCGLTTLICTSHHPEALPSCLTHCLELGPGTDSKQYSWNGRSHPESTNKH